MSDSYFLCRQLILYSLFNYDNNIITNKKALTGANFEETCELLQKVEKTNIALTCPNR